MFPDYQKYKNKYQQDLGALRILREKLKTQTEESDDISRRMRIKSEAQVLIQKTADAQVEDVTRYLSAIVTSALRHVFGERYTFHVLWDRTKNGGSIDFQVESPYREGTIKDDPKDARGGGMQNVIDFALWVAILSLASNHGPVCLDEPWMWLSLDNLPAMLEFLREIQEGLGWQVITVTSHVLPEMNEYADRLFRVEKTGGVSEVMRML